jgi:hypothetical protein
VKYGPDSWAQATGCPLADETNDPHRTAFEMFGCVNQLAFSDREMDPIARCKN